MIIMTTPTATGRLIFKIVECFNQGFLQRYLRFPAELIVKLPVSYTTPSLFVTARGNVRSAQARK